MKKRIQMLVLVMSCGIVLLLGSTSSTMANSNLKSMSNGWNDEWVEPGVSYTYDKIFYRGYSGATIDTLLNQDNNAFEAYRHEVWDYNETYIEGSWERTLLDLNVTDTQVGIHYNNSIIENRNLFLASNGYEYIIDKNGTLVYNDTSIGKDIQDETNNQFIYTSYNEYSLPLNNFPLDVQKDFIISEGFYSSPLSKILYFPNGTMSNDRGKGYWKWDFAPDPYKTIIINSDSYSGITSVNAKINGIDQVLEVKITTIESLFNETFNVTLSYVNETSSEIITLFNGTVTTEVNYILEFLVEKEFGMIIYWWSYLDLTRNFTLSGINVPHEFLRSDIPEGTYNITWNMSFPMEQYNIEYRLTRHDVLYYGNNNDNNNESETTSNNDQGGPKIPGEEFSVAIPAIATIIFIVSRHAKRKNH